MNKLSILIIFAFFSANIGGQEVKKAKEVNVLFIGNSLTYYNDMPQILQDMVNETDPDIKIEQVSYPGFSLYAHLENIIEESSEDNVKTRKKGEGEVTATEKRIQEKNWDIIVMQTGGVNILIPEIKNLKVDPAIQEILNLSNCQSKYVLFNTWTTKIDYPKEYCYPAVVVDRYAKPGEKICSPKISDEKNYAQLLESGYKELSSKNNLILTKHATLFERVREKHPNLDLLEDDMHPSRKGAFLSAAIFYELLTGKKANKLKYKADLNTEIATLLKKASS